MVIRVEECRSRASHNIITRNSRAAVSRPQAAGLIQHRVLEHGPTQPRHGNQNPTTTTSTTTVCVLAVVGFLDSSTLAPPFQCHRAQHKHSEITFCSLGTQGGPEPTLNKPSALLSRSLCDGGNELLFTDTAILMLNTSRTWGE